MFIGMHDGKMVTALGTSGRNEDSDRRFTKRTMGMICQLTSGVQTDRGM